MKQNWILVLIIIKRSVEFLQQQYCTLLCAFISKSQLNMQSRWLKLLRGPCAYIHIYIQMCTLFNIHMYVHIFMLCYVFFYIFSLPHYLYTIMHTFKCGYLYVYENNFKCKPIVSAKYIRQLLKMTTKINICGTTTLILIASQSLINVCPSPHSKYSRQQFEAVYRVLWQLK